MYLQYNHLKYNFQEDRIHTVTNLIQESYIRSENGKYYATVTQDGDFAVFYGADFQDKKKIIWKAPDILQGYGPFHLRMQDDGNCVVYDKHEKALWTTGTWNTYEGPWFLKIENTGVLNIYDRHNTIQWSSCEQKEDQEGDDCEEEQTQQQKLVNQMQEVK